MSKYTSAILSIIIAMVIFVIVGEVGIRSYHYLQQLFGVNKYSIVIDNEIGWLPRPDYKFSGEKLDAKGRKYQVDIRTNSDGFRMYGDLEAEDKLKVLFLGDSFTHAVEVSNDKTYYARLADVLPIEVFAFGGGGYGTLQEYMILDKYIDQISPDVVIVQFSQNDFINNHYELELRSHLNNNNMRRPYLSKNGQVIYKLPRNNPRIRDLVNRCSNFFYAIIKRVDRLTRHTTNTIEHIIKEDGVSNPLFQQSEEITAKLIEKIKLRVPITTPIYFFSVGDGNPTYSAFRKIVDHYNIGYIDGVPQTIRKMEQEGVITRARDGAHWNEAGHQIAADVLKGYFENNILNQTLN